MNEMTRTLTGEVTDIFSHRVVIATRDGRFLADLGPRGAQQVALRERDRVTLVGEMKPFRDEGPYDSKGRRPHDHART